jgi:hypothetical protein
MVSKWPKDVDGDVLRRMEESGFDFAEPVAIDFNIDFQSWPPADEAMELLRVRFPNVELVEPTASFPGYLRFTVVDKVTYPLVMNTQREASDLVRTFGGVCESWGVSQE